jgi:hypothetical protein
MFDRDPFRDRNLIAERLWPWLAPFWIAAGIVVVLASDAGPLYLLAAILNGVTLAALSAWGVEIAIGLRERQHGSSNTP